MQRLARTEEILAQLVGFPTVSCDSNRACIAYVAELLEAAGARVEILPDESGHKANLLATIGPDRPGGLMLSAHSDVVPVTDQIWQSDPFTLLARNDALYGRGTCDMKGFLAATLAMAPHFADLPLKRPIHYAITYDEEIGCFGAQHLARIVESRPIRPAQALIGEPTEMQVIDAHKGCFEYTTIISGLEGHGSMPDLGVNAAEYAARFVSALVRLKQQLKSACPPDSPFDPPWTTINTGALTGGQAHNVIPGTAQIDWEMRPVQRVDALHVKQTLQTLCEEELLPEMRAVCPQADIVTTALAEVDGLNAMTQNPLRDTLLAITGQNGTTTVPFGTEAGIYQALGMDVVVCGPGSIAQAHKPDEFITHSQLSLCLDLLEQLAQRLT